MPCCSWKKLLWLWRINFYHPNDPWGLEGPFLALAAAEVGHRERVVDAIAEQVAHQQQGPG
jgi:hypothetical protein